MYEAEGEDAVALQEIDESCIVEGVKRQFGIRDGRQIGAEFYMWLASLGDPRMVCELLFDQLSQHKRPLRTSSGELIPVSWRLGVVVDDKAQFTKFVGNSKLWAVLWMVGEAKGRPLLVELFRVGEIMTGMAKAVQIAVLEGDEEPLRTWLKAKALAGMWKNWSLFLKHLLSPITNPHGFKRLEPMYLGGFVAPYSTFRLPSSLDVCRHWDSFRLAVWRDVLGGFSKGSELSQLEEMFMELIALQQKYLFSTGYLLSSEKKRMTKLHKELWSKSCDLSGLKEEEESGEKTN